MTRVIGKAPIKCTNTPHATALYDEVRIESGGYNGSSEFKVFGDLSINCTALLIIELRTALRRVRDQRVRQLNQAVADAEKPLP